MTDVPRTGARGEQTLAGSLELTHDATGSEGASRRRSSQDGSWPTGSIGRYQLRRFLGAGAMGGVFAAYDADLDREVALKLLHPEQSGPESRRQVLREARALARINDPHVLIVTDVGEHEGRMYLAMELVDGHTLREWLDAAPRSRGEILDVFEQAGRGLAAAHRAGIHHRDFKPSNAMIDRSGRVRVMDFGLARAEGAPAAVREVWTTDATSVDGDTDDSWAGTPAYMAPEQHLGLAADARTDQFAFCVSVYEALYGERPFAGDTLAQLAMSVTSGDVRPAPLRASVPAALRRVLLRGLSREPADRFASMDALLLALRRARRASRLLIASAAAIVFAATAVVLAGSPPPKPDCRTAGPSHPWSTARADALRDAIGADDAAWSRIVPLLDDRRERWQAEREESCRELDWGVFDDGRIQCLEQQRRELAALLDAAAQPNELLAAVAELRSPESCRDRSTAELALRTPFDDELDRARALERLGEYDEAERVAIALAGDATAAGDDRVVTHVDLLLGSLQARRGALTDAEQTLRRAYFAALQRDDDETTAAAAIAIAPLVGAELHRPDEGLEWAAHARAALDRAPSPDAEAQLATSLGVIHRGRGELGLAMREHERALELRKRELGEDHVLVADVLNNLGNVLAALERNDEALAAFERAIAIRRDRLGPDHPYVARALSGLGGALYRAGRYEDALARYGEALAIFERAHGSDDIAVGRVLNNRGELYGFLGRYDESIADMQRALAIFRRVRGDESVETAMVLDNLGMTLHDKGDYTGAVEHHQHALAILEAQLGPVHADVAAVLNNLGSAQDSADQRLQARMSFERAISIFDALELPPVAKAGTVSNLGALCVTLGDRECALRRTEEALRLREAELGPDHPEVAISLTNLAILRSDAGDQDGARALLQRALRIFTSASGDDAIGVSVIEYGLAIAEARDGDWVAAEKHFARTLEIREAAGAGAETVAVARYRLAAAQWALGRHDEARRSGRAALAMFEEHGIDGWIPDVQAWLRHPDAAQDFLAVEPAPSSTASAPPPASEASAP